VEAMRIARPTRTVLFMLNSLELGRTTSERFRSNDGRNVEVAGINFEMSGISRVTIMQGTNIVREWRAAV
jgi:hypothetical protein